MAKIVVSELIQLFKSSVSAVLPKCLVQKSFKYCPVNEELCIVGQNINLKNINVYIVGAGKAVQHMAQEVENILGSKIKQGIISIPIGSSNYKPSNKNIVFYEGAENNLPDYRAEATAHKVKNLLISLGNNDLLIVLISGGGSSLLPLPKEPLTLSEKTSLIKRLAYSGADITELNKVRKQLSDLKGGKLALIAQPAQVISLIISDIVGDPLDLISSGPTTDNLDDTEAAINVIRKYKLENELSESVLKIITKTESKISFPKENVSNYIIGSNKMSIAAASDEARKLNYLPIELSNTVTGNVKDVANEYVQLTKHFCNYIHGKLDRNYFKIKINTLKHLDLNMNKIDNIDLNCDKDVCLILGGETTVTVKGLGKGGRNQQLALEYSYNIHNIKQNISDCNVYFLSAGTDGIDGPTNAAGAIGYLDLIADSTLENMDVLNYINNNDSYNFYKQFKNGQLHVITGHTDTNVMDIHIILIKRKTYKK